MCLKHSRMHFKLITYDLYIFILKTQNKAFNDFKTYIKL